jgi:hypothetical protein
MKKYENDLRENDPVEHFMDLHDKSHIDLVSDMREMQFAQGYIFTTTELDKIKHFIELHKDDVGVCLRLEEARVLFQTVRSIGWGFHSEVFLSLRSDS